MTRSLTLVCTLVVVLVVARAFAASPAPSQEAVEAALGTLVRHWNQLPPGNTAFFTATALLPLLQQTGGAVLDSPGALVLRRSVACRRVPELATQLEAAQNAQRDFFISHHEFTGSIEKLYLSTRPGAPFALSIAEVSDQDYRLLATGIGDLAGEEWVATRGQKPRQTRSACSAADVTADVLPAPTDAELDLALATLSRAFRAPPRHAEYVALLALELAGATSSIDLNGLDEARLAALLARVKKAGGDLEPIVKPTLNRVAEAPCRSLQAFAKHEVESLARALVDGAVVGSAPVPNYVLTTTSKNGRVTVTGTGTGPMTGDVLTATVDGLVKPKRDFCAGKKFLREK